MISVVMGDTANSTLNSYEESVGEGGLIDGSWSMADYDSHYSYACSGLVGSTDC